MGGGDPEPGGRGRAGLGWGPGLGGLTGVAPGGIRTWFFPKPNASEKPSRGARIRTDFRVNGS